MHLPLSNMLDAIMNRGVLAGAILFISLAAFSQDRDHNDLRGEWNRSPWYRSLDGKWKFCWARSPLYAPAGFYEQGFDYTGWDEITVPGTWQMQGYGYSLYRNIPLDFNPTGSYIRTFEISDVWGRGLAFWGDHLLNVAVNPYTNLQNAWYPYQLERSGTPVLKIDHMVAGVGGTPVTARERYRTYPREYSYSLFFLPF